jgi:HK97 family phage portal protein
MTNALVRGAGLAQIRRKLNGDPLSLHLINPHDIEIEDDGDVLWYVHKKTGMRAEGADVLHIRGISLDGLNGLDPLRYHTEGLGLAIAAETHAASVFGNSASPGIVLKTPQGWAEDAYKNYLKSFREQYAGARSAGTPMVAPPGLEVANVNYTPEQNQLLASRQHQVTEIARILNVQPHIINDLSRSTFSNIEEQQQSFYQQTLLPWVVRIESEINLKLIGDDRFYAEHSMDSMLRAKSLERAQYYQVLASIGALTPNEIRARENLPTLGPIGDSPLTPLNKAPLGSPEPSAEGEAAEAPAPPAEPTEATRELEAALWRVVAEDMRRAASREAQALRRAVAKDPASLRAWCDEFYAKHLDAVVKIVGPSWRAFGLVVDGMMSIEEFAEGLCRGHAEAIASAVTIHPPGDGLEEAVERLCEEWSLANEVVR